MNSELTPLFSPASIAIIGASTVPGRPGYLFTMELLHTGYEGKIYPVNPKGGTLGGLKIYQSLDEIQDSIDLALIAVNKKLVLSTVEECAKHKVKTGIIFSAGFGEMGEEGRRLQEQIVQAARSSGMRLVGPNCFGIFSADSKVNLTTMFVPSGRIALISQSGNVASTLWYEAETYLKTGFSRVICYGNQADIAVHEYIDFCADDPLSDVIVLYLEGIRSQSGLDFIRSASAAAKKKPVVIMKGGSTDTGRRAATSHTGSLAGNDALYSAAFEKAGIVQVKSLDELLPTAQALMICPQLKSNNIGVSGTGGGHMILSADAADAAGFKLPPFSDTCSQKIDELFYDFAPKGNPCEQAGTWESNLDVWGDMADAILSEPQIDGLFIFGNVGGDTPELVTNGTDWRKAMEQMVAAKNKNNKPIMAYSVAARGDFVANDVMRAGGVPVFDSIKIAMRAMRGLYEAHTYATRKEQNLTVVQPSQIHLPEFVLAEKREKHNLTEPEAYNVLKKCGINVIPHKTAKTIEEAVHAAEELGYPVVMKIVSPDIIHKSDANGVKVGIQNADQVKDAFDKIMQGAKAFDPSAQIDGVLIAKQTSGTEMIAGVIHDRQFGPVLMIGLGGVFVEIMKDVNFAILPATKEELRGKIENLKGFPLLDGARGREKANLDALTELLYNLGVMAQSYPEIVELDLNPIFVSADAAYAGDARIIVKHE